MLLILSTCAKKAIRHVSSFNKAYVEGSRLTIDKSGILPTITGSGELEIQDLSTIMVIAKSLDTDIENKSECSPEMSHLCCNTSNQYSSLWNADLLLFNIK